MQTLGSVLGLVQVRMRLERKGYNRACWHACSTAFCAYQAGFEKHFDSVRS